MRASSAHGSALPVMLLFLGSRSSGPLGWLRRCRMQLVLAPSHPNKYPENKDYKNMEETSGMIWTGQMDLHPAVCERKRSCSFHSSYRHVMAFNLFSIQLIHILHLDWDGIHGHRGWVWMGWLSEQGLTMINNSFSCTTQTLSKLASPNC